MISCILQYSTIDFKFLECNLKQLKNLNGEIIVPICSHLFNGDEENKILLDSSLKIIEKYNATPIIFDWEGPHKTSRYYHNLSRKIGTDNSNYDWLLFVDADEIISDEFSEWFKTKNEEANGFWLTCYWYFRQPIYRAKSLESAGLLIKKNYCTWNVDDQHYERQQLFNKTPNFINGDFNKIFSKNNEPLVHHFSWVRNKEEMLLKVKNWGHNSDTSIDWNGLVHEEFSREFSGKDFVHGYDYEIVDNKFNISC
jgi:hypothetical protein